MNTAQTFTLPQFPDSRLRTHSSDQCFRTCPRKYLYEYVLGIVPKYDSNPLRIGTAFHEGIALLKSGKSIFEADDLVRGMYSLANKPPYLTDEDFAVECEISAGMVFGWGRRWGSDMICEYLAVEIGFELPIINPATGAATPLAKQAGKIDGIVKLPDGRVAILEHKTTSDDLELESDYWTKLRLDAQISRYILAARAKGFDPQTTIYDVVRKPGIRPKAVAKADQKLATANANYCGLALDGECPERETPAMFGARFRKEMAEKPDFYFARNEVPRLENDLDEYQADAWAIHQMLRAAENETARSGVSAWPRNTGACDALYRCEYLDVCRGLTTDPTQEIPANFKRTDRLHPELPTPATPEGASV